MTFDRDAVVDTALPNEHPIFPTRQAPWLLGMFCLWAGLFGGDFAAAQSWDPFPELRRGRAVALAPSVDARPFQQIDGCLRQESAKGPQFRAAVVRVSDPAGSRSPSASNAVPYVDALFQHWRRNLDPVNHILIVLSLDNRGIAVHPGTRWSDLGFEGRAITRVIDESPFGRLARSGELGAALCALAGDVASHLRQLDQREEGRLDTWQKELQRLGSLRRGLADELQPWHEKYPELAANWSSRLDRLEDDLATGRRSLERRRYGPITDIMRSVREDLRNLQTEIQTVEESHGSLDALQTDLASRETRLQSLGNTPGLSRARLQLVECRRQKVTLETQLLEGQAASAAPVRNCLGVFDNRLEDAMESYQWRYVVLPRLILTTLILLALALLLAQWLRVRGAKRQAQALLDSWRSRLDRVADQLLDAESEHPLYFTADHGRWTGQSRELDQRCATAINQLYWLFSEANLLHDQAEVEAGALGLTTLRNLDRPVERLTESEIRLRSAADDSKLRLPGAPPEAIAVKASQVLDELDTRSAGLAGQLSEVTRLQETFYELIRDADLTAAAASEEAGRRVELESPVDSLDRRLGPILDRRQQAMDLISDPVSANPQLRSVIKDLRELQKQAELGNSALEAVQGPVRRRVQDLRDRLSTLRDDGLRLDEPGFGPDLRLDRARQQGERVRRQVADGLETQAAETLSSLRHGLDELKQQLDIVEHTREHLPAAVDELVTASEALRARLPAARDVLATLEREHSAEAFTVESDNLEELAAVLKSFDQWCEQIRIDHDRQHFLAAAEDLSTGSDLVRQGNDLVDGLESIQEALREAKEQAQGIAERLRQGLKQIDTLRRDQAVGAEARQSVVEVNELGVALLGRAEEKRPHWPRLELELSDALSRSEAAVGLCQDEIEALKQAVQLATELTGKLLELDNMARRETRDRPFVAKAVAAAEQALEGWRKTLRKPAHPGGRQLLAVGRNVKEKVAWADGVWRSEMDLIRLAESKLAAARDALQREHGRNYGYGVVADCRHAQGLMSQVGTLRTRRQWEDLLEHSGRILDSAHEEGRRCRARAAEEEARERRRREARRRTEERRQRQLRQMQAAAAARAAATVLSSLSSGRSSSGFGRRGGGFSSGGFGSGGSRSRGSGSSFGGNRSGGSRSGGSSW